MRFAAAFIIVFVVIIVGGSALQIFLSTRKNRHLGLMAYNTKIITRNYDENGNITEERVDEKPASGREAIPVIFLLYNIPTAVLTAVYFACRETVKRKNSAETQNKELDRMSIQDLE